MDGRILIGLAVLIIYLVGYFVTIIPLARFIYDPPNSCEFPHLAHEGQSIALSFILSITWPIIVLIPLFRLVGDLLIYITFRGWERR